MSWKDISTAPREGFFMVKGGHYDTAYSQMHGISHENETRVAYQVQSNPDVDPPFRVPNEPGLGIKEPTHWRPCLLGDMSFVDLGQSGADSVSEALNQSGAEKSTHTCGEITVVATKVSRDDALQAAYDRGVTHGFDEAIHEVRRGEIDPQTYQRKMMPSQKDNGDWVVLFPNGEQRIGLFATEAAATSSMYLTVAAMERIVDLHSHDPGPISEAAMDSQLAYALSQS